MMGAAFAFIAASVLWARSSFSVVYTKQPVRTGTSGWSQSFFEEDRLDKSVRRHGCDGVPDIVFTFRKMSTKPDQATPRTERHTMDKSYGIQSTEGAKKRCEGQEL